MSAFEVICLGAGGGPLETDVSGYMVKRCTSDEGDHQQGGVRWTDGWVSIEGGAGMGCLAQVLADEQTQKRIHELEAQVARLSISASASASAAESLSTAAPASAAAAAAGLFDDVAFPPGVDTPILKAAFLFGYLTAYVITHAHLDHMASMIIHTGSLSCPRTACVTTAATGPSGGGSSSGNGSAGGGDVSNTPQGQVVEHALGRIPIYASKHTLEGLDKVYNGETWPALAVWSTSQPTTTTTTTGSKKNAVGQDGEETSRPSSSSATSAATPAGSALTTRIGSMFKKKERAASHPHGAVDAAGASSSTSAAVSSSLSDTREPYPRMSGIGVQFCPTPLGSYQRLPRAGLCIMEMPIAHGHNDRGTYHSSAFFFRRDDGPRAEFLFWGDVGSKLGDDDAIGDDAPDLNRAVWKEAASRWDEGRLRAVFIECSYDSSRPNHLMFGHLVPTTLYGELATMATLAKRPLAGMRVFVTHVKESLIPGTTARQKIAKELAALEATSRLGLRFQVIDRGARLRF